MPRRPELRSAHDRFADLLAREDSLEREWQRLFSDHPLILSESLPLRILPSQIIPLGRPGRSEPDFYIYPDTTAATLSTYGVIELKRPSTPILTSPRQQVLKLSADAETAYAQAKLYATQLESELYTAPDKLLVIGSRAHIFLIVGRSEEMRAKVITDIERQQFQGLLPAGVQLLPYDTLFKLFQQRVPPLIHVAVPSTYAISGRIEAVPIFGQLGNILLYCARSDNGFAERLTQEFARVGVNVRTYQHNHWSPAEMLDILNDTSARVSTVVLILSEASAHGDAVASGLIETLQHQTRRGRRILLPIALDSSWRQSSHTHVLAEYNVLDFENWKNPEAFGIQFLHVLAAMPLAAT